MQNLIIRISICAIFTLLTNQLDAQNNLRETFIEILQNKGKQLNLKILISHRKNTSPFYYTFSIENNNNVKYIIKNDTLVITCNSLNWDKICKAGNIRKSCDWQDIEFNGNLIKTNDFMAPLVCKIAFNNLRAQIPRVYNSGDPVLYFQEAVRLWPNVEKNTELCELVSITVGEPNSLWTDEKAPALNKSRALMFILNMINLDGKEISLADFKKSAEQALGNGNNITTTEEQRKFIVQANLANEEKQYTIALELYQKVFQINEFNYPQGYFNSALIAAQLQNFILAIINMEKYLILAPNADDARKAKDKIYEWEFKIKY